MDIFKDRDYFLFDGAMGTYYSSKYDNNIACEAANLSDGDTILSIHREYIEAGVNAIKTNTFGANRFSLSCEQHEVDKIVKKGWEIANEAAKGHEVLVFADIGPIPVTEGTDTEEEYKKIVDIFLECGARYFLFETFAHYDILLEISAYIRLRKPGAVIITSFTVYPDGYSKEGLFYVDILNKVGTSGLADACGFNCICGPAHMCRLVGDLDISGRTITIMPNSGYPASERGRTLYVDNSEYFAGKILELKKMGVKILGGCCGTTPRHIEETAKLLAVSTDDVSSGNQPSGISVATGTRENILHGMLEVKKPILVEIDPPFDTNWEYMLRDAFLLKKAGANMITISDSPLGKARADSAILASKIQREAGIPVMPHITCRDRNLLGLKATLLGLNIEGIRNVLAVTGDPIASIERKIVKGVFSINSCNLANYISSLNKNIFGNTAFEIGGALNVNAVNFEAELRRSHIKIENGISYFLTQAAYTETAINNIIRASEVLKVPVFVGIMPIVSFKNALFINNEVPGIKIEDATIEMFRDKDREEAAELGVELAVNIIEKLYSHVAGFYLMTPLKKTQMICDLIKRIKEIEI